MKTYLEFVDAVSGDGHIAAANQCALCLTPGNALDVRNLAKDLRDKELSTQGRPWAIRLCANCLAEYTRLFKRKTRHRKVNGQRMSAH